MKPNRGGEIKTHKHHLIELELLEELPKFENKTKRIYADTMEITEQRKNQMLIPLTFSHLISQLFQLSTPPICILNLLQLLKSISVDITKTEPNKRFKLIKQSQFLEQNEIEESLRQSSEDIIDLPLDICKLFADRS